MRRFRVERELGRGGFGRVLLARELGPVVVTPVAIKLAQGMWRPCPDDARRARDEARLLAQLDHPAIVRLQCLIQTQHGPALILEYVPGFTLHQILKATDRLPIVPALELVAEVADALDLGWTQPGPLGPGPQCGSGGSERSGSDGAPRGHERPGEPLRLLHRDIKPSNLMITPVGTVKVLDFGIARAAQVGRELPSSPIPVGTTDYMAPERTQQRGQPGAETPAGDVFGLGLVLFGALTGAFHGGLPQDAEGWVGLVQDFAAELLLALDGEPLAEAITDLVLAMTARDPAERPEPAAVRDLAFHLARAHGGEGLRPWALRTLPTLPTPKPDALSGYAWAGEEITEVEGEPTYEPTPELPAPPALARVIADLPAAPRGQRLTRRRPPKKLVQPVELTWPEATPSEALESVPVAVTAPPPAHGLEPVPMPATVRTRRAWPVAAVLLALVGLVVALWSQGPAPEPDVPPVVAGASYPLPVVPAFTIEPAALVQAQAAPEPPAPKRAWFGRRVRVGLTGEVPTVALVDERGAVPLPGELRPGTYTLRVTFPGWDPMDLQQVELMAGHSYEVACTAHLTQCSAKEVP